MLTLFPSLIVQQQVNSLSTCQIIPKGEGGYSRDVPLLAQANGGLAMNGVSTSNGFDFNALLAEYAAALEEYRYADWVAPFAPGASYKLQARENFDRGIPLCTMAFEGQGMLRDRIY
jgi:hypothetical protein